MNDFILSLSSVYSYYDFLKKNTIYLNELNVEQNEIFFNTPGFETKSLLNLEKLGYSENLKNKLYSTYTGAGTSTNRLASILKSISESIETWAFRHFYNTNKHGFSKNSSSDGMAAMPILNKSIVHQVSNQEAIERWALRQFNLSKLPVHCEKYNFIDAFFLVVPFESKSVVILRNFNEENKRYSYGFSCGDTNFLAIEKAKIELFRNRRLLSSLKHGPIDLSLIDTIQEKRLVFFSEQQGADFFDSLVSQAPISLKIGKPSLYINQKMNGPWDRYAEVWRVLYKEDLSIENYFSSIKFFLF